MANVQIEKTFDGRYAVYVDGRYRFAGDEAACRRWIAAVITKSDEDAASRDTMLRRAIGDWRAT